MNQVILDTHTAEAVNVLGRHPYAEVPDNENIRDLLGLDSTFGAHVDVENFSDGNDIWGTNIPRLDPPLRLASTTDSWGNELAGMSGAAFPYPVPQGEHGFALPGEMTDWAIDICRETYGSNAEQCTEEAIVGLLPDLRDEGRVMLVSTHNLGSVPEFCDRAILLNRTVLAYGRTGEVFTQANLERTFGGVLRHIVLKQTEDGRPQAVDVITDDERALVLYGNRSTPSERDGKG